MEYVRFHQGLHQVPRSRLPEQEFGEAQQPEGEAGRAVSGKDFNLKVKFKSFDGELRIERSWICTSL